MNIINYQIIYHQYYLLLQLLELCNFFCLVRKRFSISCQSLPMLPYAVFFLSYMPQPFHNFSLQIFSTHRPNFSQFLFNDKIPPLKPPSKSFQIYHSFPQNKTISVFLNSFFNSKKCPVRTDLDLDKAIRRRERKR